MQILNIKRTRTPCTFHRLVLWFYGFKAYIRVGSSAFATGYLKHLQFRGVVAIIFILHIGFLSITLTHVPYIKKAKKILTQPETADYDSVEAKTSIIV